MMSIKGYFCNGEMWTEEFKNKKEFEWTCKKIFSNSCCTSWDGIYKNGEKMTVDNSPKYIKEFLIEHDILFI